MPSIPARWGGDDWLTPRHALATQQVCAIALQRVPSSRCWLWNQGGAGATGLLECAQLSSGRATVLVGRLIACSRAAPEHGCVAALLNS